MAKNSKNNPDMRDNSRLIVYCPETGEEMKIIKMVPGGMAYKCEKTGKTYPLFKGSYKNFPYKWIGKK